MLIVDMNAGTHDIKYEKYNLERNPVDGKYYGYCPPKEGVNLKTLSPTVQGNELSGVTVVYTRKVEMSANREIIAFCVNAVVHNPPITNPALKRTIDNNGVEKHCSYSIESNNLTKIPDYADKFVIDVAKYSAQMFRMQRVYKGTYPKLDEEIFMYLSKYLNNMKEINIETLQRIYYGAPGTGKSHAVNELTKGENVIRTTFHPDCDYSTFVGAYKPTMRKTGIINAAGKEEAQIAYTFVPQAFLKAYIKAWRNFPKPQYIVIEEINRGNCAQIFGDIFQLLDRDEDGFSKYPIDPDDDIRQYIAESELTLDKCDHFVDSVKKSISMGEIMILPSNLYIWATMNTSDQSLFPIDSAFKRRWDWVYVPIANVLEKKWRIVIGNKGYGWWDFLEAINKQIGAITNSEDKKLGFFFCQAKDNVIDAKTFVSKVIFYLWNDVFKNYGFEGELFKANADKTEDGNTTDNKKEDIPTLTFDMFYETNNGKTQVNVASVQQFLKNLGVEGKEVVVTIGTENGVENNTEDDGVQGEEKERLYDRSRYYVNKNGPYVLNETMKQAVQVYVDSHPQLSPEKVVEDWKELGITLKSQKTFIQTEAEFQKWKENVKDAERRVKTVIVGSVPIYVSNQVQGVDMEDFISRVHTKKGDWGILIEKAQE